jgi:hypothetical protein
MFWVCVCSLSYSACNKHCHLWHVWLYQIFPHTVSHKTHNFRKNLLNIMSWFSPQTLKHFSFENNSARYDLKCTYISMFRLALKPTRPQVHIGSETHTASSTYWSETHTSLCPHRLWNTKGLTYRLALRPTQPHVQTRSETHQWRTTH